MRNLTVVLVLAICLMGGFYGGFRVGENRTTASASTDQTASQTPAAGRGAAGANGAAGAGATPGGTLGGRGGANAVVGSIVSVSGSTMTVHDRTTNADVTVSFSSGTPITKSVSGQASDLLQGATVQVQGLKGADGTVQAQSIALVTAGSGAPTR